MLGTALGLLITIGGVSASAAPATFHAAPITTHTAYVTQAAIDELTEAFPSAKNVQWKGADEEGVFTAYFMVGSVKTTANIDKDGKLLTFFRYYDAGNLPDRIRTILADQLPGKDIQGMTEMVDDTSPDGTEVTTYQGTLEDAQHIYKVRLDGRKAKITDTLDKQ